MSESTNASARPRAASPLARAIAVVLHVLLLLLVLGQVVYLASRHRVRVDMTSDQVYTTTDSTRRLLDRLEERLLVEAYFSPKEELPVAFRQTRVWADNFLEELRQLGKGRVTVTRLDPNSDKAVTDKATRLGIQPQALRSQSATSVSLDQHWQGLRLRYGDKQTVVPAFWPTSTFQAEAIVTPKIKEALTEQKRRFGYMEWPATAVGQRQPGSVGWTRVRTHEGIQKRYEFQNLKDEDGALLPDDVDTLFLFRPKELTDRQKYVLDQFLLGGGTLVVFADAAEYALGPQRLMTRIPFAIDANGSGFAFVVQLRSYGDDWRPRLVADKALQAYQPRDPLRAPWEYFAVPVTSSVGIRQAVPIAYPYFFHAVATDWADVADQLAKDPGGRLDEQLARRYRETFVPGLPSDEFLFQAFKKINRGPGLYWPTWVGLREQLGAPDLPDGVDGRVLMWSSPLALVEDPPQRLDPVGRDPMQMRAQIDAFNQQLEERLRAEPRLQAPLMVEVEGRFRSFFAGRERPKRPSEIAEEQAPDKDAGEPGEDAAAEPGDPDDGPQPASEQDAAAAPRERAMRVETERPGRIVVIGDATFLRDDVLGGDYQQLGGPYSGQLALPFFAQLLDWLAEDEDLVGLQSRTPTDRSMSFVAAEDTAGVDARDAEQRLRDKTRLLIVFNVVAPCALLAGFGLLVWCARRTQTRALLASAG